MNDTWDFVSLSEGIKLVICEWVYLTKYALDGIIEILKEMLVSKVFSQVEGIDYNKTFPTVTKMDSILLVA